MDVKLQIVALAQQTRKERSAGLFDYLKYRGPAKLSDRTIADITRVKFHVVTYDLTEFLLFLRKKILHEN